MTWPIPPSDLARQIITSHAEDVDHMGIGEMIDGKIKPGSLTDDEFDTYRDEVEQLISDASIVVTLPGDPVCPACAGSGQPCEDDGTPKNLPQWEAVHYAIETWLDNEDDVDGLTDQIMKLFGSEQAETEGA